MLGARCGEADCDAVYVPRQPLRKSYGEISCGTVTVKAVLELDYKVKSRHSSVHKPPQEDDEATARAGASSWSREGKIRRTAGEGS